MSQNKPPIDIKDVLIAEAQNIVKGARRAAYGTPQVNFDRIAKLWNAYIRIRFKDEPPDNQPWIGECPRYVDFDARDVAAMIRLMKEARLIETPDHHDSFVDLIGYALCGAEVSNVK